MENQINSNQATELESVLKVRALSALAKREDDTMDAVQSWVNFKNAHARKHRGLSVLALCAIVALACISSTLFISRPVMEKELLADVGTQTMYVPAGQRAQLDMPDGTKVWINSNTKLTYPTIFSKTERRVILDGEAYFEVSKDQDRPFLVESDKATVQVLGTHFNVQDYKSSCEFVASLLEGKVNVKFKGVNTEVITLEPHECIMKKGNSIIKKSYLNEDFLLWRKGIYTFDDCTFQEVLAQLEIYYDVKIVVKNPEINKYRVSGKCRQSDGIEGFLKPLQKLYHFSYQKDNKENTITIY